MKIRELLEGLELKEEALDNMDVGAYGAWYSPTGELHHVPFLGHEKWIISHLDIPPETQAFSYKLAYKNKWVRLVYGYKEMDITGKKEDVQNFIKRNFRSLKDFETIRIDDTGATPAKSYVIRDPAELRSFARGKK